MPDADRELCGAAIAGQDSFCNFVITAALIEVGRRTHASDVTSVIHTDVRRRFVISFMFLHKAVHISDFNRD